MRTEIEQYGEVTLYKTAIEMFTFLQKELKDSTPFSERSRELVNLLTRAKEAITKEHEKEIHNA